MRTETFFAGAPHGYVGLLRLAGGSRSDEMRGRGLEGAEAVAEARRMAKRSDDWQSEIRLAGDAHRTTTPGEQSDTPTEYAMPKAGRAEQRPAKQNTNGG